MGVPCGSCYPSIQILQCLFHRLSCRKVVVCHNDTLFTGTSDVQKRLVHVPMLYFRKLYILFNIRLGPHALVDLFENGHKVAYVVCYLGCSKTF